ncbi:sugar-transfer associated ATP-grasp domain-containing protein [uncultured Winogradskyella sp.]|uniref:sugar-transfer associated ATP-grasp domain-containing protein n=1 Tax=uncultured Winogradskyella sp. TaxID=395353 RepID=UPI0030DBCB2C|tara:strand:+ start:57928 stop:59022 length:1095 start_codon:yes stop_codon:yes gene_type:complete
MYSFLKKRFTKIVLESQQKLIQFNAKLNAKRKVKAIILSRNTPKLTVEEEIQARLFFKKRSYKLNNLHWHMHFKDVSGAFYANYIPEDIYRPLIDPKLNQITHWPALVDKNLTYNLFSEFNQPKVLVQNINGFYYVNNEIVDEYKAIMTCLNYREAFIIKPTVESGKGKLVQKITVDIENKEEEIRLQKIFTVYKKDFIIQEVVNQSETMKALNSSSLNTLRVATYLRQDGSVHLLSTVSRIGNLNSSTDNYSLGGVICGIKDNGDFKDIAYSNGKKTQMSPSGVIFSKCSIPKYASVKKMVKALHIKVPYFRIISWDIGIDINDDPIFIEYNVYNQSLELHQITNGPIFGEFTDEILKIGKEI